MYYIKTVLHYTNIFILLYNKKLSFISWKPTLIVTRKYNFHTLDLDVPRLNKDFTNLRSTFLFRLDIFSFSTLRYNTQLDDTNLNTWLGNIGICGVCNNALNQFFRRDEYKKIPTFEMDKYLNPPRRIFVNVPKA